MRALPVVPRPRGILVGVVRADVALFSRVARARTPWLDRALPLLSRSANHSALWIAVATGAATGGGRRGRRAAVRGLGSIAVTSLIVNQAIKRAVRRPRPTLRVPIARRVDVAPLTTSFPSGHAASAAGIGAGVAWLTRYPWPVLPARADDEPCARVLTVDEEDDLEAALRDAARRCDVVGVVHEAGAA